MTGIGSDHFTNFAKANYFYPFAFAYIETVDLALNQSLIFSYPVLTVSADSSLKSGSSFVGTHTLML